jgi:hypothetical protein
MNISEPVLLAEPVPRRIIEKKNAIELNFRGISFIQEAEQILN